MDCNYFCWHINSFTSRVVHTRAFCVLENISKLHLKLSNSWLQNAIARIWVSALLQVFFNLPSYSPEVSQPSYNLGQFQKQFLFCNSIATTTEARLRSWCWSVISGNRSFQRWNFHSNFSQQLTVDTCRWTEGCLNVVIFYYKFSWNWIQKAVIVTSKLTFTELLSCFPSKELLSSQNWQFLHLSSDYI